MYSIFYFALSLYLALNTILDLKFFLFFLSTDSLKMLLEQAIMPYKLKSFSDLLCCFFITNKDLLNQSNQAIIPL